MGQDGTTIYAFNRDPFDKWERVMDFHAKIEEKKKIGI